MYWYFKEKIDQSQLQW